MIQATIRLGRRLSQRPAAATIHVDSKAHAGQHPYGARAQAAPQAGDGTAGRCIIVKYAYPCNAVIP